MRSYMKTLSSSFTIFRSASSWFEVYAAFSTSLMLLRTAINDLLPEQVRSFITSKLKAFFSNSQSNDQVSLQINRFWEAPGTRNELYHAAHQYLPTRITRSYKALKVGKLEGQKNVVFAVDGRQEVVDHFEGTKFTWTHIEESNEKSSGYEKNTFILSFDEKHRDKAMEGYIPHLLTTYEAMKAKQRIVKIYSMQYQRWRESDLSHPATFDTLAIDPELKQTIIGDLDRFLRRKELYKKVGKPWKRGYLLYGPSGTGKSSLIAAMANYLKFNVYDLELTSVYSNSDLMRVMRETSNRSIIVIEDIDCNKEVHARLPPRKESMYTDDEYDDYEHAKAQQGQGGEKFTLSGLLNYMDGLWSSCGEERIIIFTTNYKDKIDPALLRPGRMDMHIELSFLKGKAFRILASNYLDTGDQHPLLGPVQELLEKTEVTPAEVAEQLMRSEDPDVALDELVKFLKGKDTAPM